MAELFTIRDDYSRFGLRRLHVMQAKKFEQEQIDELGSRAAEEGAEWVDAHGWDDEVGNFHLYLAWRPVMEKMFLARGGSFEEGVRLAAEGYERRFGRKPNRAGARTPTPLSISPLKGGEVVVVELRWLRAGDVGAWYEEDIDGEGRDVALPERARDGRGGAERERDGESAAVPGGG